MKVRNDDSVADGTTLATVVGHQDGVEIFAKTMVDFGTHTPDETGVTTWTATIINADPDNAIAVETTKVK